MSKDSPFPGSWQRAMLPMLLLAELSNGHAHGYALSKSLQERGFGPLKGATLYPALAKLEAAGLVETRWQEGQGGPGRKVYELAAAGRVELAEQRASFEQLTKLVQSTSR
ncbi:MULTISPECIES: PadR family transcriptional regulator [Micrococcaceae]|uniref:PadR family transcriptional regulator n=1 Tax=Micrococcaceae TaxID=1268 RepID=UPI001036EB54|nr:MULTISPECIES: PadR family transcriptional regulator [Micrococcaceae]TAP27365.1 PadR family transcriptional regulator [Arthrobacter sp. S41]UXN30968.1 PadR family transcriptional regulator [Glutamicibacter sp. M10]